MPLTEGRRRIRFRDKKSMLQAIKKDAPYQYRHYILSHLMSEESPATMKMISNSLDIPINAVPKVMSSLIKEGLVTDIGRVACQVTGNEARGFLVNDLNGETWL